MAKKRASGTDAIGKQEPRSLHWRREIEICSASGLSQVEFCRRRGLSLAALRWWKWKLKSSGSSVETASSPGQAARAGVRSQPPRFLPVRVVPAVEPAVEEVELPRRREIYELELRGGHRLRVPADFEPSVLHRLILTVEATSC